jgi:zinc protease
MLVRKIAFSLLLVAAVSCKPKAPKNPDVKMGDDKPKVETPDPNKDKPKEPIADKPKTENEMFFPEDEYRKVQPAAQSPRDFKAPSIEQFKLANGLEVYLIERHQLPIVSAQLTFEGGSRNDPEKKVGLANLCMSTMGEGTATLDKVAFEEALADLASSVNTFAAGDQQSISFNSLSKNVDATLDIWADVLLKPGLRQADFDRLQKQLVVGIERQKKDPQSIARRLLNSIVYGTAHPSGRIETEAGYKAITLKDCQTYIKDYIKPTGTKLYVLGDITKAQLEEKFGKKLETFKGKPKAAAKLVAPKPRDGRIFFVHVPKAEQSSVYLVSFGPKRQDPDFFANSMMASILGGGFSSRINMNIREKNGFAYGASGGFSYDRDNGVFFASGSIRTDVTKQAIIEIINEVNGMRDAEVTDEELNREKNGTILSLPTRWSTGFRILGTIQGLVYFKLPLNYYDSFVAGVQKVTKADVLASAKKNVDVSKLQVLVVGDKEKVLPGLEELMKEKKLGEGKLVILDADGVVQK